MFVSKPMGEKNHRLFEKITLTYWFMMPLFMFCVGNLLVPFLKNVSLQNCTYFVNVPSNWSVNCTTKVRQSAPLHFVWKDQSEVLGLWPHPKKFEPTNKRSDIARALNGTKHKPLFWS